MQTVTSNQKIDTDEFEAILKALKEEALDIDIYLANRIGEILKWIHPYKSGSLLSKKFVVTFLKQFIVDSEIHLGLHGGSKKEKSALLAKLAGNQSQKYWYVEIFPKWLRKKDHKISIWKNKLMEEKYAADDRYIKEFVSVVRKNKGGSCFRRYVADLSMATDIVLSYRQQKACCVQLTKSKIENCGDKLEKWEEALEYWEITKGIFVSFDPTEDYTRIVNQILWKTDNLHNGEYSRLEL